MLRVWMYVRAPRSRVENIHPQLAAYKLCPIEICLVRSGRPGILDNLKKDSIVEELVV
jgi:hypothetical protein